MATPAIPKYKYRGANTTNSPASPGIKTNGNELANIKTSTITKFFAIFGYFLLRAFTDIKLATTINDPTINDMLRRTTSINSSLIRNIEVNIKKEYKQYYESLVTCLIILLLLFIISLFYKKELLWK